MKAGRHDDATRPLGPRTRLVRSIWWRLRARTTWRDLARLGIVFVVLALTTFAWGRSGLIFNHTLSMPIGLYRVQRTSESLLSLGRGTVVVWCLPEVLATEARRRHYLVRGQCPGDAEPILKEVAALAGDTVVADSAGLAVNGHQLPHSAPLMHDSRGLPLRGVERGTYIVGPGEAWVWSPYNAQSFDSRYYGALPVAGLVGVAKPVWTWHRAKLAGTGAVSGSTNIN